MSEKSYVKIMLKRGVTGGSGFESEAQMVEGTDINIMFKLVEDTAKVARKLIDEKF